MSSGQLNESLLHNPAATVRTPRRLFQDVIRHASLNAPRYGRFRRSASILFNLSSSVFNCCMASFRALVSLASWTARERRERINAAVGDRELSGYSSTRRFRFAFARTQLAVGLSFNT